MLACVNCGRALQPAWKYCIFCGTRTTAAAAPRSRPLPGVASPEGSRRPTAPARTPVPAPVIRVSTAQTPVITVESAGRVNPLAVLALILGILASPLAALFGHVALGQLRASNERGVIAAWVAMVLGYLWLGFFLVLGISYLATNG